MCVLTSMSGVTGVGARLDVCVVTRTDHTDYWPDPDSGPSLPGCAAQSEGLTFLQGTKKRIFIALS